MDAFELECDFFTRKGVHLYSVMSPVKMNWARYGIVEFNVPLDTVQVISETTTLSSDLPFSNGGPAT